MNITTFLITPPFTQLNTPYPATAYLKGFLNTKNITSLQADLGIEVINALFCKNGLTKLFNSIKISGFIYSKNAQRIIALQKDYIHSIDAVIQFLQGKNATLAYLICKRNFLPEAARFEHINDFEFAFGNMGIQDHAKHLATMYLEDLSDLIQECIDPHFGFSRYAERLGRSANSFDELYEMLHNDTTYIDSILIEIIAEYLQKISPKLVAISVPFPGNLYAAFRCGQYIKKNYPNIKVAMGGGFANTELRSLSDVRVFEFFDFITLDDGEAPIENLIAFIEEKKPFASLKRTFTLVNNAVVFFNNATTKDYKQGEVGTPDYSDFKLDQYISAIEIVNPMHRLWSDGRWNKLTMAHGCYWGKCTFCDISLDYIKLYEPVAASLLCDRIETLIHQTGQNGFHFVDEAAPPALMRALALEILRRNLTVVWWTNIRFEKSFTLDLCLLLKASGCIAVSGGLEVASDRLLLLIQKGITVAQVAKVTKNFTQAGVMVHAYLMYGFPTQSAQETIDSLEMVRQLFALGILQSAFWHQFAMTAHSPVGLHPELFNVKKVSESIGNFANNDVEHIDTSGAEHALFGYGLKKSLLNYMHGICFEKPLQFWFNMQVPHTTIDPNYISNAVINESQFLTKPENKIVWIGNAPTTNYFSQTKKGISREMVGITFITKQENHTINLNKAQGDWLVVLLEKIHITQLKTFLFDEVKQNYEEKGLENFEMFWENKPINTLSYFGLLKL